MKIIVNLSGGLQKCFGDKDFIELILDHTMTPLQFMLHVRDSLLKGDPTNEFTVNSQLFE